METKRKSTFFHFLATFGCFILLSPQAYAITNTPLDCPGVVIVQGGYRLTQNTTCDAGFFWQDNNQFFNLNGYTLTADSISVAGTGLSIRNGKLQVNGMHWEVSVNGGLYNLIVKSGSKPRGLFIETGDNFNVRNSSFINIPGVALSFYYGNGGMIKNSIFTGNERAISIQKSDDVLIEHNKFESNALGVNLWDEDGLGVNNNLIRYNIFRRNDVAINMLALPPAFSLNFPVVVGNQILGNKISRSSRSGLFINLTCDDRDTSNQPICPASDTKVSVNSFNRNGFGSPAAAPDNDGITARANLSGSSDGTPYPEGLAGITLTNNRADRNADLGFDVEGVTDGGGQVAAFNGNSAECIGVECSVGYGGSMPASPDTMSSNPLTILQYKRKAPSALKQYRHH